MTTKTFVYSHRRDPDGICSAAILKRHLGNEGVIDFIDFDPVSELMDTFKEMEGLQKNSTIIIADFSVDPGVWNRVEPILKNLKEKNGCKIEWSDHHKWDEGLLKEMGRYAEMNVAKSTESCGAELVYKKYMKGDKVSEALAKVGRDHDIDAWLHKPPKPAYALTFPLADLIIYRNYMAGGDRAGRRKLLNELVDKLAEASEEKLLNTDFGKSPFWDPEMEKEWKGYKKWEAEKFEECSRTADVMTAGKYKYVLGRPDDLLSTSMSSSRLLEKFTDADFSIVVYGDGKMSMRRRNGEIKCNEIAALFGGAGHEYAAGGRMEFPVKKEEDYQKAKSVIAGRVANLYSA